MEIGSSQKNLVAEQVHRRILFIRGHRVVLDRDLAELYGVPTKVLNQAVKRNCVRFPKDFMFRLSKKEKNEVVTICDHLRSLKFSTALPYVFTEHGAIMVASILNTSRAIQVSVYVVRAFVKFRKTLPLYHRITQKLDELERHLESHDGHIRSIFEAIRQLMTSPRPVRRRIGFHSG